MQLEDDVSKTAIEKVNEVVHVNEINNYLYLPNQVSSKTTFDIY